MALFVFLCMNEELERSPYAVTSLLFDRNSPALIKAAVMTFVIGMELAALLLLFSTKLNSCIFVLWLCSACVPFADLYFEIGLLAYNALGVLLCFFVASSSSPSKTSKMFFTVSLVVAHLVGAKHTMINDVTIELDGLPSALHGLRIAHLSDLHIGPTLGLAFVELVVERTIQTKPDLIVITGDVMDGTAAANRDASLPLGRLRAYAPTFMVTGNHDHLHGDVDNILERMRELGVVPLRDDLKILERLQLVGVDDYSFSKKTNLTEHWDPLYPGVLLAHQPKSVPVVLDAYGGSLLVLSGHTHCGQMFPFQLLAWFGNPYFCGHYVVQKHQHVYVSAGTGHWGPNMRLWATAEIVVHTLISL